MTEGLQRFLRKQLTALDMVLNTPLSLKRSTYYYNADVFKDPNDYRSSRPEVFCRKDVLKNFTEFTGKHLCQSLFFNKVAGLRQSLFFNKVAGLRQSLFFNKAAGLHQRLFFNKVDCRPATLF